MRKYICLVFFFFSYSNILNVHQSFGENLKIDSVSVTPTSCRIPADGAITVHISGGKAPYIFECSPLGSATTNEFSYTFTGLTADTYQIRVIDGDGFETGVDDIVVGITPNPPTITLTSNNIQCFNGTGSIVAEAFAGIDFDGTQGSIVSYQLYTENGTPVAKAQPTGAFNSLTAGKYTVHVQDSYGCENQASAEIYGPDSRLALHQKNVEYPMGNKKGSITVTAAGGWGNYTIICSKMVGMFPMETKRFVNVAAGDYGFENLDYGQYQFVIGDKGGCVSAPPLIIELYQTTGEIDLDTHSFNIYPNPSGNGLFVIEWNKMENRRVTLEIYNLSGHLVYKSNVQTGTGVIFDLGSQNSGAYLLYIPELNIRQKLIVQ